MDTRWDLALTFFSSAAVGLLVGLERERNPRTKAGLRTNALIAVLGSLCALIAQSLPAAGAVLIAAGVLAVAITIGAAHLIDPSTREDDSGTTTTVAAVVVFLLGAASGYGHTVMVVAVGIAMTALLHFKSELEGAASRLTTTDIRSMLQFGIVSAVILPVLPNQAYGPYGVLNPFHIWLMVVLIAGVSLTGYVAWRLTWARRGLLLTGILGGLVSSTATTLAYARQARSGAQPHASACVVLLLANATMFARVLLLTVVVAVAVTPRVAMVLLPALLAAIPALVIQWRRAGADLALLDGAELQRNPTQLGSAIVFAAGYALVLLISAWVSAHVGAEGLYGVALVSGLTDVDAITLTLLRMFNTGSADPTVVATSLGLAVAANLVLKAVLAGFAGGWPIGRAMLAGFAGPMAALAAGMVALQHL
jgi:uncharacterized membrane protein (DUF4010 family)